MELSSDLVGTALKPYSTEISWRHMMNYAAAVQDDNPVYFDDRQEQGVIAHPMFPVAVTWPLLQNLAANLETASFPSRVLASQVHYSECLYSFQPIRPGHHITINGIVAAVLPHRSGTHMVIRLDAIDEAGEAVFTEYAGALLRGVNCSDGGRCLETLPLTPDPSFRNRLLWEERIFIHPMQTYVYDGCTSIFFPIHTSTKFAQDVGLPGIILQGTATLAYAVRELINKEAASRPLQLKRISCRFRNMVFPGTHIRVQLLGRVSSGREKALHFVVRNDRDQEAISKGYALLGNALSSPEETRGVDF